MTLVTIEDSLSRRSCHATLENARLECGPLEGGKFKRNQQGTNLDNIVILTILLMLYFDYIANYHPGEQKSTLLSDKKGN